MDYFFPFLVFCIVTMIAPGPNNIMIMTSGLNYGIKQSLPHYAGIIVGFPGMVFLVGYCLGDFIAKYPFFHHVLDVETKQWDTHLYMPLLTIRPFFT